MVRGLIHFRHVNGELHQRIARGEVEMVTADGRNFLLASRDTWDCIISEPSNPWISGSAKLFTREFFADARTHLSPRGVFGQWVQLYGMDPTAVRSLARTFRDVFPHVYVFVTSAPFDLLLLGSAMES